jgi:hypothetical protein
MIIVKWKALKAKACRLLQGSVSSDTAGTECDRLRISSTLTMIVVGLCNVPLS